MPLIVHSTWPAPASTRGQAVGHGQAQVVVAVDADDGLVDVRHAVAERADDVAHVRGRGVADGVGNVDRRGAGVDGRLDHLRRGSRARCARRPRARTRRRRNSRRARFTPATARRMISSLSILQLVLAMDGAGGQEDVDPRPLGVPDRLPGAVDVGVAAAGQAADDRAADRFGRSARTASKSPGEAMGKPASITSTPRSTRAWATSIFSARFMLAPGDCSPSRSVVSKITMRRGVVLFVMVVFRLHGVKLVENVLSSRKSGYLLPELSVLSYTTTPTSQMERR